MMNQKGFTLLEILISITLLSFVMMGVISVTENSTVTKERVTREDRESLQIETAMAKVKFDFTHIYSPLFFDIPMLFDEDAEEVNQLIQGRYRENDRFDGPDYNNRPIPNFSAPEKDTFEFFTLSNRRRYQDQKQSRFGWVKYTVEQVTSSNGEKDIETKALVRYFSADNPYANQRIDTTRLKPQILLERIDKLIFYYWDPKKSRWQDSIDFVEDGKNKLRGLKLEIKWKDSQGYEKSTTRIFRALFPSFTPEDVYAILKKKIEESQKETSGETSKDEEQANEE
jgi:prepilin-type N-terminal cleavage/methylation domain-containing protein